MANGLSTHFNTVSAAGITWTGWRQEYPGAVWVMREGVRWVRRRQDGRWAGPWKKVD